MFDLIGVLLLLLFMIVCAGLGYEHPHWGWNTSVLAVGVVFLAFVALMLLVIHLMPSQRARRIYELKNARNAFPYATPRMGSQAYFSRANRH